jgi:hypothetical protein
MRFYSWYPKKKLFQLFLGALCVCFLSGLTNAQVESELPKIPGNFRYDLEFPAVGYGNKKTQDRYSLLIQEILNGKRVLSFSGTPRGYLDALLDALQIDPSSQVLVWSKTSVKRRFIGPSNPRAIYFNDDVYVGYVPGSSTLEIAAIDPEQGPVFFDLSQDPLIHEQKRERISSQEISRCLRCHDTYSMTGGGVPRLMISSVLAGSGGEIVSHEISEITDTSTPLSRRWGGWYVTAHNGSIGSMANFVINDLAGLTLEDLALKQDKRTLEDLVDLSDYLRPSSDIVALLVLEHQVEFFNRLSMLNFYSKQLLAENNNEAASLASLETKIQELLPTFLETIFMTNSATLPQPVLGTSEFADQFQNSKKNEAAKLRRLELQSRVFTYPFSYLFGHEGVKTLPSRVQQALFTEIRAEFSGELTPRYTSQLTEKERKELASIVNEAFPFIWYETERYGNKRGELN